MNRKPMKRAALLAVLPLCAAIATTSSAGQTPAPASPPAAQTESEKLAAAVAATPPGGKLPVEAFGNLPFLEAPQLSPDGTRVVAKLAIKGEQRLVILTLSGGQPVQLATGGISLEDWRWVNKDWIIATVAQTQGIEGQDFRITRTAAISADGKKIQYLSTPDMQGQNASDVLWMAHDGSPRILLAMQKSIYYDELGFWPTVREFDVSTNKSHEVQPPRENIFNWRADASGTVRLGIYYDDDRRESRMVYREAAGQTLRVIDSVKGRESSLSNIPDLFLADPHHAVSVGDDDKGFSTVYDFDLTTLKRGDPLFSVPGYDVDGVWDSDDGTRLMGAYYTDTATRVHWFDPKLAQVQADLDKAVGASRRATIISWDKDFATLLVLVDAPNRPGDYFIYQLAEGTMHLFAHRYPALGNRPYAPVKTIHYKARDGLDISAVLTLPVGKAATDLPLILMPHGGPMARDDESWDWWVQFMANRGYAVLQPNYRGSTGFGTEFLRKGRGEWGLKMQDDLVDAVKWASDQHIADPKRVCIVGGSYGGYAALRAAQRDTGVYRCAVSFAGVSDMNGMVNYDSSFLNSNDAKDYFHARTPDLKAVSPVNFAGDFSVPVLLVHGKADLRVPVRQSRQMANQLKAAGKTYRYVEQPLGDHHFSRAQDRIQFLNELEAFLTQYNPA